MSKHTLLKSTAILAAAGVIVKILGAFFRIPLANLIGDEGMGYFQATYPIYRVFYIIAIAGVPVAISKLLSENIALSRHHNANKIFKVAFFIMAFIGFISFLIIFFGASFFVGQSGVSGSLLPMKILAPALIFVVPMSALRGFFQGHSNMRPTAVSEVLEQSFRVIGGLLLAYILFSAGKDGGSILGISFDSKIGGATGATFGATFGGMIGFLFMGFVYILYKKHSIKHIEDSQPLDSVNTIFKKIFIIAAPITLGGMMMPLMGVVDVFIVIRNLKAIGFSEQVATGLYGSYSGFAGSVVNMPQSIIMVIAMSIVPLISSAFAIKNYKNMHHNIGLGYKLAAIIAMPSAMGMIALAKPIMLLLFPAEKEAALNAVVPLVILSFGIIFLALAQTSSGILQGIGKQFIPVKNIMIAMIFKFLLTFILTRLVFININGAAIGTVIAYIISSTLGIRAVIRNTGYKLDFYNIFGKPLISSIVMGLITFGSYKLISTIIPKNSICTLISILIGVMIYSIMMIATKAITLDDIDEIGIFSKLSSKLRRFSRKK